MSEAALTEAQFHRKMAADFFNRTWQLLDQTGRTRTDDDAMIHLAHASRCHWQFAGDAGNLVIGEWQISRVYAVLRRAEPALHHARRCLELCEAHAITGFNLACAHEALARALTVTHDPAATRHRQLARELGEQLADPEERKILFDDLETI